MIRPMSIGALCLTAAVSVGIYALSYDVQKLEVRLAGLNRDLIAGREAIQVLDAEWSYLNQPERLQSLAAKYLDLEPIQPRQIMLVADLPMRRDDRLPLGGSGGATPRPGVKPALPPVSRRSPTAPAILASMGLASMGLDGMGRRQ